MAVYNNNSASNYISRSVSFSANKGTVCGWFKFLTLTTFTWECAFEVDSASDSQVYCSANAATTDLTIWGGGGSTGGTTLSTDTWYFIALTFDGTNSRAYLGDNSTPAALDIMHANTVDWGSIRVGSSTAYGEASDIVVGSLKAFDDTLTLDEVKREQWSILPKRIANLLGYWPCFAGSGERVRDYSSNGSDFSETGTVLDRAGPPTPWGTFAPSPVLVAVAAAPATGFMTTNRGFWGP